MAIKRGFVALGLLGFVGVAACLMPGYKPVQHVFFASVEQGQIDILAHGGGQGVAPTNTLLALQTAARDKADILEVDVQLTKDNVLVVHHDDTLDRTTDLTGPVAALTWAEIKARDKGSVAVIVGRSFSGDATKVARLDDVLAALPNQRWNIEIKNDKAIAAQQLCQSIQSANLTQAVLVASFHDKAMATFRKACPGVATSMAPGEIRTFIIAAHMRVARFVKTPAVAVQVPVAASGFDLTHPRFVAALKARNIKLHYWTINDPGQMRRLLDAGADGLLTDFVRLGQEEVARAKQSGLHEPMPSRP
jgi:glycerophosphoryl diester phosphodiesterase